MLGKLLTQGHVQLIIANQWNETSAYLANNYIASMVVLPLVTATLSAVCLLIMQLTDHDKPEHASVQTLAIDTHTSQVEYLYVYSASNKIHH